MQYKSRNQAGHWDGKKYWVIETIRFLKPIRPVVVGRMACNKKQSLKEGILFHKLDISTFLKRKRSIPGSAAGDWQPC